MPDATHRSVPGSPAAAVARRWAVASGLAVVSAAAMLPVLASGWVEWDDEGNFTRNPDFGGLSLRGLAWAWTTFCMGVYQPLGWLLCEAEFSVWGLQPLGYHAVSLAFHAAIAVALFFLTSALLERLPHHDVRPLRAGAAVATLLFAAHPLRVEAVAWTSAQSYLPSILCSILATLAYLRAHPGPDPVRRGWLAASWVLTLVAVLFKAVAATLPVAFVVLDAYPLRRLGPGRWLTARVWREKALFLALTAVFLPVAYAAKRPAVLGGQNLEARAAQACYGACFFLTRAVWPFDLSNYYPVPPRVDLRTWPFSGTALATAVITASALAFVRRRPGVLAAWVAYLVILGPNSGVVRVGKQLTADRYGYLATVPLVVPLAWAIARLFQAVSQKPVIRKGVSALFAGLVLWLAALSWFQCLTWRTSTALWSHADALAGGRDVTIRGSLAGALLNSGDFRTGMTHLRSVLRADPDAPMANYNMGVVLVWRERYDEAEGHFVTAVRGLADDSPFLADAHYNLALVYENQGRFPEALAEYSKSVALNPRDPSSRNNLGAILLRLGRAREAEASFAEALRLRPGYPVALRNLQKARRVRSETPLPIESRGH